MPQDSNQTPGTVLGVAPEAGSTIAAGSGVVLQIASGNLQVPVLVGLTDIQARTTLVQAGFLVQIIYAYDSTQPIGTVLAQAPSSGATETIGSSVTITVNKQN